MKKFLSVILCVIMLLPAIPITAGAEPSYNNQYEHLYYTKYDDHIEITGCDANAESVNIPAEIDGLPVTSIGDNAFAFLDSLTNVTIPSSVTSIGFGAFLRCESLTSITIPSSVTVIGDEAFYGCSSLTSVTISNGVTSIGNSVFSFCNSLTNVTIPNSVISIGDEAFYFCDGLTSVTIPSSVTIIGDWAFDGCKSLTDIYYGGSEEDWQNIYNIYNEDLANVTIHYNSDGDGHPQISVSEPVVEGGSITITAETKNIEGVGELFAVGYDGGKLTASEKLQDGAATLPAEDVKTIKVFCWDSLDTMRPLCEPKTITIK